MSKRDTDSSYVEALKRERDRFVALAFCAADVLIELDRRHQVMFAAGATGALLGAEPGALIGRPFFELIAPADRPLVSELIGGMSKGARIDPISVKVSGPGGGVRATTMTGYHLPELADTVFLALRIVERGTDAADGDGARRDPDTGLLLKDVFAREVGVRLAEPGSAEEELKLTLVRLRDVGQLRSSLDRDAARGLAKAIGAFLRAGAAGGEMAGKFDDEHYGLVHAPGLDVAGIAGRIERVTRAADPGGKGVPVETGTVDAAFVLGAGQDAAQALLYAINGFCERAEAASGTADLSATIEHLVADAASKMTTFRQIVSADSFHIAFQPIVRVATEHIHHFEALARFGGGSDHSPYELITFAENTGLICEFDFAMCRKVIDWVENANRYGHRYIVAVNLSGRSVGNHAFLVALRGLLKEHPELRSQIMVEITESAQIRDLRMANRFIQSLREVGHKVCLDDFGAGAAALKYLHALDVDVVKIDGQYIRGALDGKKYRAFLRAIVGLCKELGIATIAEMVEDRPTVALLKELGIEYGQGYLYGRPSQDISAFEAPRPGAAMRG